MIASSDVEIRPYHAASQLPAFPERLSTEHRQLIAELFVVMRTGERLESRRRGVEYSADPEQAIRDIRSESDATRTEEARIFDRVAELCSEVAAEFRSAANEHSSTCAEIAGTLRAGLDALGFVTTESIDERYERHQQYGRFTAMIREHRLWRDAEEKRLEQSALAEQWSDQARRAELRARGIRATIAQERSRRAKQLLAEI